jgi:hypothetical protein
VLLRGTDRVQLLSLNHLYEHQLYLHKQHEPDCASSKQLCRHLRSGVLQDHRKHSNGYVRIRELRHTERRIGIVNLSGATLRRRHGGGQCLLFCRPGMPSHSDCDGSESLRIQDWAGGVSDRVHV